MRVARKIIWITWENHIRSKSLSRELGVQLFEMVSDRHRVLRYAKCISRTVALLWHQMPSVVICQNPSLVLSFLLLRLRRFFRFKVIIDAHFGGVEAYNGSETFQKLLDHCNRKDQEAKAQVPL